MARSGALSLVPSGPSRFGTVSPPVAVGVAIRPFANSQVAAVGPSFARTPSQLGRERRGPIHRDAAVMGVPSHRGRRAALAGPKPPPDGTRGGPRHHEFGGRRGHVRSVMHAGIRALIQRTRTPPLPTVRIGLTRVLISLSIPPRGPFRAGVNEGTGLKPA